MKNINFCRDCSHFKVLQPDWWELDRYLCLKFAEVDIVTGEPKRVQPEEAFCRKQRDTNDDGFCGEKGKFFKYSI